MSAWASLWRSMYVNMNIIMKGHVSPIKMNFNELFNIMKGVY